MARLEDDHHPRNVAIARHAVQRQWLTRDQALACLDAATLQTRKVTDIAVERSLINGQQAQFLLDTTDPFASSQSGEFDPTVRFHGQSSGELTAVNAPLEPDIEPTIRFAPGEAAALSGEFHAVPQNPSDSSFDPTIRLAPGASGEFSAVGGLSDTIREDLGEPAELSGDISDLSQTLRLGPGSSPELPVVSASAVSPPQAEGLTDTILEGPDSPPSAPLLRPPSRPSSRLTMSDMDESDLSQTVRTNSSSSPLVQASRAPSQPHESGSSWDMNTDAMLPPEFQKIFEGARYQPLESLSDTEQRVQDRRLRRPVLMYREPTETGRKSRLHRKFLRRARTLARLDHPAIPRVHDSQLHVERPYFTTDPLPDTSLESSPLIVHEGSQSLDRKLRLFNDLLSALIHAHKRGVFHTALRPHCVRLGPFGEMLVTGWDHSVIVEDDLDPTSTLRRIATDLPVIDFEDQRFLSPERVCNTDLDDRSDVWSLGALLFWMITGEQPRNDGPSLQVQQQRDQQPCPRELAAIVAKATHEDVDERYGSVSEFQQDLMRFLDGKSVEAAADNLFQAGRRIARRHPGAFSVVLAGLATLLVFASVIVSLLLRTQRATKAALGAAEASRVQAEKTAVRIKPLVDKAKALREQAQSRGRLEVELLNLGRAQALRTEGESDESFSTRYQALFDSARALDSQAQSLGLPKNAAERVLLERADWRLRHARPRQIEEALEDYRRIVTKNPNNDEATLGVFLTLRSLPNSEEQVLAFLEQANGRNPPTRLSPLFANESRLRKVEKIKERARSSSDQKRAQTMMNAARQSIYQHEQQFLKHQERIAFAREQSARYHLVKAGVGHSSNGGDGGAAEFGYYQMMRVSYYDPVFLDKLPFVFLEINEKYGLASQWRHNMSYVMDLCTRQSEFILSPASWLCIIDYLFLNRSYAAALIVCKKLFKLKDFNRDTQPRLWQRASLALVRAQLATRTRVTKELLEEAPDAIYQAEWHVLKGHLALLDSKLQEADKNLSAGLTTKLASARLGSRACILDELVQMFSDRRVVDRHSVSLLDKLFPPQAPYPPHMNRMRLSLRIHMLSQLGFDFSPDLQQFSKLGNGQWGPYDFLVRNAQCKAYLQVNPQYPDTHLICLETIAAFNTMSNCEAMVYPAKRILTERLRHLKKMSLVNELKGFDPVEELWVRRHWFPKELFAWHGEPYGEDGQRLYPRSRFQKSED